MLGASPLGVPVRGRVQVNVLRPAVRLGRGVTSRVATVASSGSTLYFLASFQKRASSSFTFPGFAAATSFDWVQSLRRSYSSHGYLSGEAPTPPVTFQGGRITLVLAIHPSW